MKMRRSIAKFFLPAAVLTLAASVPTRADEEDVSRRLSNAGQVLQEFAQGHSPALSEARCIGVVPSLKEAAFIAGGKYGGGVITCKDARGQWSAPAFFSMTGGTFGAQAGYQHKNLVVLAMTEAGKHKFFEQEFDLGAAAEVTAGNHSAGANWQDRDISVYTAASGAFAGANVSGTSVHRDDESMDLVYGKNTETQAILEGTVRRPAIAEGFLNQVQHVANPGANPRTYHR
jgi:lipid-binding SYLF domain-containing protein